jgi:N4-(beta-N-acetylglucosaminyl)-L-asparaginase
MTLSRRNLLGAIVGAGCFTDNDVGWAGSTGRGEANILVSGGHLALEFSARESTRAKRAS